MPKSLRVLLAIDDESSTTTKEEEEQTIKILLRHELDANLKFVSVDLRNLSDPGPFDLMLIDYGGMGVGFGHTTMIDHVERWFYKLTEERPSSVFQIWSSFTTRYYKDFLNSELGILSLPSNVLPHDGLVTNYELLRTRLGVGKPSDEALDKIMDIDRQERQQLREKKEAPPKKKKPAKKKPASKKPKSVSPKSEPKKVQHRAAIAKEPDWETVHEKDGGELQEPIRELSVPLRIIYRPGQKHCRSYWKAMGSDVSDDEGNHIGSISGCMGGGVEMSFTDEEGQYWSYYLDPRDIWDRVMACHKENKEEVRRRLSNA